MRHDFSDKWAFACALKCIPCYDKEGQDCLKMKGIMSYEVCHFIEMHFQKAIHMINTDNL